VEVSDYYQQQFRYIVGLSMSVLRLYEAKTAV